ncbi:hypothetical protein D210916BOD24_34660 [Alteromonas sp. D210916BOD_24]|uniref:hypothetical protein n=1 Tax=Alteromonas sp. D210916BOD_24 TaxID=3157618 RepID=UPI00399C670B
MTTLTTTSRINLKTLFTPVALLSMALINPVGAKEITTSFESVKGESEITIKTTDPATICVMIPKLCSKN